MENDFCLYASPPGTRSTAARTTAARAPHQARRPPRDRKPRHPDGEWKTLAVDGDSTSWQFDELAHAGREHLDADYVAAYDEKSPTDWSEDVEVLLELGVGATSTVVDLGAGTGTFAQAIAPHVGRVVAVDVSEPMVAAMRARGLEAVHAGFLSYAHEGDPPAAVYTRNALHHLPDFWKAIALERIARLLRSGGVLRLRDLVYSFEPRNAETAIGSWLAAAPEDPAQGWTAAELAEHVREEHSTFTWFLEPMLERVGFDLLDRWMSPNGMYAAYTCRRRA
jgi:SAM-dependent methyltransferase